MPAMSPAPAPVPVPVPGLPTSFDSTFGAILLAGVVTALLFGILALQMRLYFSGARTEMRALRLSLVLLLILNLVHVVCIIHCLYFYLVTHFANPLVLAGAVPWSLPLVIFFGLETDVLVQGWFIYRIWKLSRGNLPLTTLLAIPSAASFGVGIAITVRIYAVKTLANSSDANSLIYLSFGLTIVADFTIAVASCYYLRRMRSNIRRTSSAVNRIMVYVVNTGLLTSLISIASIVVRIAQPDNFIYLGLFFPLSNLYSNALLGSLNMRDWFRGAQPVVAFPLGSAGHPTGSSTDGQCIELAKDEEARQGVMSNLAVRVNTNVTKATL